MYSHLYLKYNHININGNKEIRISSYMLLQ